MPASRIPLKRCSAAVPGMVKAGLAVTMPPAKRRRDSVVPSRFRDSMPPPAKKRTVVVSVVASLVAPGGGLGVKPQNKDGEVYDIRCEWPSPKFCWWRPSIPAGGGPPIFTSTCTATGARLFVYWIRACSSMCFHQIQAARFSSTAYSPIFQFRRPQFQDLSTKSRPFRFSHSRLMAMAAAPVNGDSQSGPQRNYQVVATTHGMGIRKDGVLSWKLLGDLKFSKELTLTTSDPAKKNAVIMGRKTWESFPIKSRPLPGRLNVILTLSGSFDFATVENVVICGSMKSALLLLASTPYCLSIEKFFVIGGGQVLREYLNGPACEAIHLTDIQVKH